MKKNYIAIIVIVTIVLIGGVVIFRAFTHRSGVVPENGFVPDEKTAIKIAEAVWYPIYGDHIENSRPFSATYDPKKNAWIVVGYLPENMLGGVPEIHIRKSDGKILYVNHGM